MFKTIIAIGFLGSCITALAASDDETLILIEQGYWEVDETNIDEYYATHSAENVIIISPRGIAEGIEASIASDTYCEIHDYALDNWRVYRISDNVAIVTFRVEQDATCDGSRSQWEMIATSTYVNREGKWLNNAYQTTRIVTD